MKLTEKHVTDLPSIIRNLYRAPHEVEYRHRRLLSQLLRETVGKGWFDESGDSSPRTLTQLLLTVICATEEIGLKESSICAILLCDPVECGVYSVEEAQADFAGETVMILENLLKVSELYRKNSVVNSENFSHFLLSFAEDIRVVLILIAGRLSALRLADLHGSESERMSLAMEVSFLYAPIAHRLGLYNIKSEMEDLCLKFSDRETFNFIKRKLNETKKSRDAYIADFVKPVRKRLTEAGLRFEIKGRTKSISSIRNKLKKQDIEFEAIYDLFAIRIILDVPLERERSACWQVYSIITDMYKPNPNRLKDWVSIPKSNGYESLHITVMGPGNRWVEVQIRSQRMDEIAERGVAAHWRYKGIKSESGLDEFMTGVRRVLEQKDSGDSEIIKDFKMDLYDKEIYVFTPKGDLIKLPQGATVLDFAFVIHSGLGEKCVSGKVNGKNVSIRHVLKNGDSVSILTSNSQQPKADWLRFVVTSKARVKIKQNLREQAGKALEYAKEELRRRMKNRKLDMDEGVFTRLLKRKGYKTGTDFYNEVSNERVDLNAFLDEYKSTLEAERTKSQEAVDYGSAESFVAETLPEQIAKSNDVLLIDKNLSGVEYKLAKCCNPIYGDKVFAFVSHNGIKVHRMDCPNAPDLFERYGYRVLQAQWAGSAGSAGYGVTVKIVGNDDISVVTNISSQISKEPNITLRSFHIDSNDGLFTGYFTIYVDGATSLKALLKKLRSAKGVKSVNRLESSPR